MLARSTKQLRPQAEMQGGSTTTDKSGVEPAAPDAAKANQRSMAKKVSMSIGEDFRKAKRNLLGSSVAGIFFSLGQLNLLVNPPSEELAAKLSYLPVPIIGGIATPPAFLMTIGLGLLILFVLYRFEFEQAKDVRENSQLIRFAMARPSSGPDELGDAEAEIVGRLQAILSQIEVILSRYHSARSMSALVYVKEAQLRNLRSNNEELLKLSGRYQNLSSAELSQVDFREITRGFFDELDKNATHGRRLFDSLETAKSEEDLGDAIERARVEMIEEQANVALRNLRRILVDFRSLSSAIEAQDVRTWRIHDLLIPRLVTGCALFVLIVDLIFKVVMYIEELRLAGLLPQVG